MTTETATPAPFDGRATSFAFLSKAFVEVSNEAKALGLLKRARWFYLLLGIVLALGLGGVITGVVLLGASWWQLLIAAALGVVLTQISFITHEAAHRAVLTSGRANDRLARFLAAGVVGISYAWWDSKHSRHHANPNQLGRDPDIAPDAIAFRAEDAAASRGFRRFITRHQGWLFFPLLTLVGLDLHIQGVKHLLLAKKVKGRWLELGLIAARFTVLLGFLFWMLPLGMAVTFLAVQLAVFGVYMGGSFAPNHKGMPIIERGAKMDFFSKQVRTSRNVCGGWWVTALLGGLNYQVEHHLFPNMPRPNLARARRIVRAQCERLNVPYTETSLWRSYIIVVRYLNRVGLAARDPFECPMTAMYRRG